MRERAGCGVAGVALILALSSGLAAAQGLPRGVPPFDASRLDARSFDVRGFDPLGLPAERPAPPQPPALAETARPGAALPVAEATPGPLAAAETPRGQGDDILRRPREPDGLFRNFWSRDGQGTLR